MAGVRSRTWRSSRAAEHLPVSSGKGVQIIGPLSDGELLIASSAIAGGAIGELVDTTVTELRPSKRKALSSGAAVALALICAASYAAVKSSVQPGEAAQHGSVVMFTSVILFVSTVVVAGACVRLAATAREAERLRGVAWMAYAAIEEAEKVFSPSKTARRCQHHLRQKSRHEHRNPVGAAGGCRRARIGSRCWSRSNGESIPACACIYQVSSMQPIRDWRACSRLRSLPGNRPPVRNPGPSPQGPMPPVTRPVPVGSSQVRPRPPRPRPSRAPGVSDSGRGEERRGDR